MRILWIVYSLLICKEIHADISAKVGALVRLPCNTTFDDPVDWRYQIDPTIDEEYVCIAATVSRTTNCQGYKWWPRIDVIDVSTPGDYTLTVHNVTVSDSGLYHCVEQEGEGMRHTIKLTVSLPECASNPCQNNGTCTEEVNFYTCVCPAGFTGSNCDSEQNKRAENRTTIITVSVSLLVTVMILAIIVFIVCFLHRRKRTKGEDTQDPVNNDCQTMQSMSMTSVAEVEKLKKELEEMKQRLKMLMESDLDDTQKLEKHQHDIEPLQQSSQAVQPEFPGDSCTVTQPTRYIQEQLNFFRLSCVLVEDGTSCLRQILEKRVGNLKQWLTDQRLHVKKNLTINQLRVLYPNEKSYECAESLDGFDMTLLSTLLCVYEKNRDFPEPGLMEVVQKLRQKRNMLYAHAVSCSMNDIEYTENIAELITILNALCKFGCDQPNFERWTMNSMGACSDDVQKLKERTEKVA